MCRRHRQPVHVGSSDRRGGHELRRCALCVGEVRLPDPFADGYDDPLPADHRTKTKGDRNGDPHPYRNELRLAVERFLVVVERRDFVRLEVVFFVAWDQSTPLVPLLPIIS